MSDEYVENLRKPSAWLRVLFMAGFLLALYVAGVILLVLMLAQILFSLITGADNANLRRLGSSLTLYVAQILQFLTYNREDKPFPFAPFPLANEDEIDDVTAADTAPEAQSEPAPTTQPEPAPTAQPEPAPTAQPEPMTQPEPAAPAAGSETAAESAARVMAESAARRATRSTSKTPKASTAARPAAVAGPEMDVTDVVDKQANDV